MVVLGLDSVKFGALLNTKEKEARFRETELGEPRRTEVIVSSLVMETTSLSEDSQ